MGQRAECGRGITSAMNTRNNRQSRLRLRNALAELALGRLMQPTRFPAADADPEPLATSAELRECPHCGLFQRVPPLTQGTVARCPRCRAVLRRRRVAPLTRPLAMAVAGLLLLAVAAQQPLLGLDVYGLTRQATLLTGPVELQVRGMTALAAVILATTLVAPALRLLAMGWVLGGLRLARPPAHLVLVFRWVEWLRPWSMVEVYLLGVFVAYSKLGALAQVQVGPACYAMGALMLTTAAADAALDPEAVWEAMPRPGKAPRPKSGPAGVHDPIGCDTCGQVSRGEATCPRCGAALRRRKPDSLSRTWALVAASVLLYLPANTLPVLTYIRLGRGEPSTILGGVRQLIEARMWPLAALVFFASITVPVLKVASLTLMLVATHRRSRWRLRERTRLYRIVDFVGRWSMIDVFMISILTALVRLGLIATVYPGTGVLAFCAVVVLTMLAAACFDPRLMWDAASQPTGAGAVRSEAG